MYMGWIPETLCNVVLIPQATLSGLLTQYLVYPVYTPVRQGITNTCLLCDTYPQALKSSWQGDYLHRSGGGFLDQLDLLGLWDSYSLPVGSVEFGFLLLCPPVSGRGISLSRSAPDQTASSIWESHHSLGVLPDPRFSKGIIDSEAYPGSMSSSTLVSAVWHDYARQVLLGRAWHTHSLNQEPWWLWQTPIWGPCNSVVHDINHSMEPQLCNGVETLIQLFSFCWNFMAPLAEYSAPHESERVPLHPAWYKSSSHSVTHWVNIKVGLGSCGIVVGIPEELLLVVTSTFSMVSWMSRADAQLPHWLLDG